MSGNQRTRSAFADITLLILLSVVAILTTGCSVFSKSETPKIPDFPNISELPLSEASDRARVERTLAWSKIVDTCNGIDHHQPIVEFATVASTSQNEATDNLKVNEYAGEVWKSSRLVMERGAGEFGPDSFYATITYLDDIGFASWQLEGLKSLGHESTNVGSAIIVQSPLTAILAKDERASDQITVIDDHVVSEIVVVHRNGVEPFCSRGELYELAEQLVAGNN